MLIMLSMLACMIQDVSELPQEKPLQVVDQSQLLGFQPLPNDYHLDEQPNQNQVTLGERLFGEVRISKSGKIACSSCHQLAMGGVDGLKLSPGHDGTLTTRNTPTVFNAAGQFAQFWDGRALDVETQALGPILAIGEMGMPNEEAVVAVLKADQTYVDMFAAAFPGEQDPITLSNVGKAIGAYERTLVAQSRWDDYLRGESNALTTEEKEGLATFLRTGCQMCHTGTLLGGQTYMKFGVVHEYGNQTDLGRFSVTSDEADRMRFKVPQLRLTTLTAPYFHDGSAATLEDAVKTMAWTQLGKTLTDEEAASITRWLKSTEPKPQVKDSGMVPEPQIKSE